MNKKPFLQLISLMFVVITLAYPAVARADNSTIPDSYQAAYHRLLESRQHFMELRAESIRNLNEAESWLVQMDRTIPAITSPGNRQKLVAARAGMMDLKNRYRNTLDYDQEQLDSIEKDLAWLEAEMKHFACLR